MYKFFCGIDVSKDSLAVAVLYPDDSGDAFDCPNDAVGHKSLARRLKRLPGQVLVALEATSTYSLDLALALHATPGVDPALINPRAARDFARAAMQRAKTDPLDARGLALFALRMRPKPWQPPRTIALELRSLSRRLFELTAARIAEQSREHALSRTRTGARAAASCQRTIALLDAEAARVEAEARELVRTDSQLEEDFQLLDSAKGIAQRSAILLLGELACLPPNMGPEQWAALAGLDPRPVESGTSLHPRRLISRLGNVQLRTALFMPMLTAVRFEPAVARLYNRLVGGGKPKRVAHCAVMRKLLHALWAMLRYRRRWDPDRFMPLAA